MKQYGVALIILTLGLTIGSSASLQAGGEFNVNNGTDKPLKVIYTSYCNRDYHTGGWNVINPHAVYATRHPDCAFGPVVIVRQDTGEIVFAKENIGGFNVDFKCIVTEGPGGVLAVSVY
jgi:hypothetical protein